MRNTDDTKDAQNLEKIEAGIEDLLSQSKDELKDELEKEAALVLKRGMRDSRKEISEDMAEDMGSKIYQNKPQQNVKDRSVRQTAPTDSENTPDTIYDNKENQRSQDISGDHEEALKENVDRDHGQALQENVDRDHEEALKENKSREKGKDGKTTSEAPKTGEASQTTTGVDALNRTPKWEMPETSQGDIAETNNSPSKQSSPKEKSKSDEGKQGQQEQNGKELHRQKRLEQRKKAKENRGKRNEAKAEEYMGKIKDNVGKMSPMAFMLWLFLAVLCDIGSFIPYVGLLFSWPYAAAFAGYKWIKKIKKEVAVATTAMDFLLEGFLSTLPVNTLDVFLTFIISRSSIARAVTKKIAGKMPGKIK